MTHRHVLITGGMGFIGHHLVKKYLQANFHVTVVDNLTNHYRHAALTKYRLEYVDHKKCDFLHLSCSLSFSVGERLTSPPRSIIHLAGHPNQAAVSADKFGAAGSMPANTLNVAEMAQSYNAKIVYVSSSMAYGNFTKIPMPETEPLKPINLYGLLKAQGEDIVRLVNPNHVIVRPSAVYGPGDNDSRVLGKWIRAAMSGDDIVVNNPAALLDFTHVDDLASGIIAAETNGQAGEVYNLTYGQARSLGEAAHIIKHDLKSKSQIQIPEQIVNNEEPQRGALDISKAQTQLGYRPRIDLVSGLENYIDWMRRYEHVY